MIWFGNAARKSAPRFTMRQPALLLLLPLFAGCASQHFSEYSGAQIWLTSKGGTADSSHALPVYFGWPERPYRITGCIQADNCKDAWRVTDTAKAARLAHSKGGDALMIHCDAAALRCLSCPIPRDQATAYVLKWKPQNEVDEEHHRLDGLRSYLRRSYPALHLESRTDLWETSVELVASLGLDIDSRPGAAKLEEVIQNLIATNGDTNTSQWLFKGTLSKTHPGNLPIQHTFYGIATLMRNGAKVSLVSDSAQVKLAFTGRTEMNYSHGEMKLTLNSVALAEQLNACFTPGKILMHCDNTTLRWDFVFLR